MTEGYPQQPRVLCTTYCTGCFFGSCTGCISNQYYQTGLPVICAACSSGKTNCNTCNSVWGTAYCTGCIDTTTYLDSGSCPTCSSVMPGCQTCTSSTYCLSLSSNQYYLGSDNLPHTCDSHLTGCATCTSSPSLSDFVCSTCSATYLMHFGSCVLCDFFMSDCTACTNDTFCTTCNTTFYVSGNNSACMSCSLLPNCYDCTGPSTCVTCVNNSYYADAGGVCTLCGVGINNCLLCSVNVGASQYNCTTCNISFYLDSNVCQPCSVIDSNCL